MNQDWTMWALIAAMAAFFFYTRFVGKISSAEARRLVTEGARLVDVRSAGEFAGGHLAGAVNIPVNELPRRMAEVGAKDEQIVLYCASGARSGRAAGLLREAGYARVADLGAMSRW